MKTWKILAIAGACAVVATVALSASYELITRNAARVSRERPIEEALAAIELQRSPTESDQILVARFRSLLDQLASTYAEDRYSIANQTVRCQELLEESGVRQPLIGIMEGMNLMSGGDWKHRQYADLLVLYHGMRVKGLAHDETMDGLSRLTTTLAPR